MISLLERRRNQRRAGASSRREYSRLIKQWRADHRAFFVISGTIVVTVFLALAILSQGHFFTFLGGAVAGGLLAVYVAIRESPPPWIENYQRGAFGEERTATTLAPLRKQGWVVVHDLPRTKSNLDHVIVGPGGVFVLDTKNYRGSASVVGDVLTMTYETDRPPAYQSDSLARRARAQGREVNQMLQVRGLKPGWVSGAVVLWSNFEQKRAAGYKMTYIHGDALVEWLLEQPARLNAKQIAEIVELLRPGQRRRDRAELHESTINQTSAESAPARATAEAAPARP